LHDVANLAAQSFRERFIVSDKENSQSRILAEQICGEAYRTHEAFEVLRGQINQEPIDVAVDQSRNLMTQMVNIGLVPQFLVMDHFECSTHKCGEV
jgi:hypothetical protein